MTFKLPEDLQAYLEETEDVLDGDALNKINSALAQAVQNPEAYIEENRGIIEQYRAVTASAEYQESPAGRLQTALKRLLAEAGYNDVSIPAMRRLSPEYGAVFYRAAGSERGVPRSAAISEKKDLPLGRGSKSFLL